MERLLIVTALWGEWHVDMFLNKSLPSLLHESNFGTLAKKHFCRWKIYAKPEYLERVDRIADIAREVIPVDVVDSTEGGYKTVWHAGERDALQLGAMAMYLPPDVVWSRGSMSHIANLISDGKKAIFVSHPRGMPEEFDWYPRSSEELMKTCKRRWHALNHSAEVMNNCFTNHPEFVLWPITNGWICRMFARELFVADPKLIGFNDSNLPDQMLDERLMHVVGSSEDVLGVSLAPENKDRRMHGEKNALTAEKVAEWSGNFHSYTNPWMASKPILWKYGRVSDWEVESAVKASQRFVDDVYPLVLRAA